jgi:hypothetical protein
LAEIAPFFGLFVTGASVERASARHAGIRAGIRQGAKYAGEIAGMAS